jgi:hypothetical protein
MNPEPIDHVFLGYKKMMVACLAQHIKDYINIVHKENTVNFENILHKMDKIHVDNSVRKSYADARRYSNLILAKQAKYYINSTDNNWVFDFEMVCNIIGLDPERLRRLINNLNRKSINAIYERLGLMEGRRANHG